MKSFTMNQMYPMNPHCGLWCIKKYFLRFSLQGTKKISFDMGIWRFLGSSRYIGTELACLLLIIINKSIIISSLDEPNVPR